MFTPFLLLLAGYVGVVALVHFNQRKLIYPVPALNTALPDGFERVEYATSDGLLLSAGYRVSRAKKPTLVFFHGNGSDWQSGAFVTRKLAEAGYGVLAASYRGYGGNAGEPSERGFYADGRAAFKFLESKGIEPQSIVPIGNSIGSGVATQMASEFDVHSLVLISPFDSLTDTASRLYPWAPVRLLLRDRYDNLGKLPTLEMPILILHGEDDTLIAEEQARTLAAARVGTRFVSYPD